MIVTAQKNKYSNLARKLEITKGMMDTAPNKEIVLNIPMLKEKYGNLNAYAVLSYSGGIKNIKLHALSCSGETLSVKASDQTGI